MIVPKYRYRMTRLRKVPKHRNRMNRFQLPNTDTGGTKKVPDPSSGLDIYDTIICAPFSNSLAWTETYETNAPIDHIHHHGPMFPERLNGEIPVSAPHAEISYGFDG